MSKAVFPACASFGPILIAMGSLFPNRGDTLPFGFFVAAMGALVTSAALIILFRAVNSHEQTPVATKQSTEPTT
jgi:uncharacterized membrane protein